MAAVGVEEYESDPEDAILPSVMRRREASDDEDDGSDDGGDRSERKERAAAIVSDGESDDQGGAPAFEEEGIAYIDDDEQFDDEEEIVEVEGVEGHDEEGKRVDEEKDLEVSGGDGARKEEEDEEKKENEPYAVPTAGAFYMHDDRFQENGRGRQRRMTGGRRLWESRDDRAWVHDRFEEMNLRGSHYDEGRRNSRGRFRGRGGGRGRGTGRGYTRDNRPRGYYDDDANKQNRVQKTIRGRGPKRYEPLPQNDEVSASLYKQSGKSQESRPNTSSARLSPQTSNVQPEPPLPRKQVFASSLNSASPPFYPSSSSKQDLSATQKRDSQSGNTMKSQMIPSSVQMESAFLTSQSGPLFRGQAVVDSVGHDKIYTSDSMRPVAGKNLTNAQVQSSGSPLASLSAAQSAQSRVQGRNLSISAPSNFQTTSNFNQVARVPAQIQLPVQHRPQTQFQTALRISTQQVGQQKSAYGSQIPSPPYVSSTNSAEVGEADSPTGSSKSKTQLDGKGKTGNQGSGQGSFLYGGAQIIGASGAMGLSQNDQNFSPALLPVVQFGGQHHGGLGVPAVGMAFPGYMAQPQLGLGNSEMTWVPVLAGAAGALGASYPYIALDGSYYPHSSGQTSSSIASSKESSTSKPVNTPKAPQRPEIVNDEFGQRQNKPRRYSEMNFGQ